MTKLSKDFYTAALIRAIRTGAQTALSLLTLGVGVFDVDWLEVISITIMAMIVSILTSIVTGLPETTIDGVIDISEQPEGFIDGSQAGDIVRFKLTDSSDE